MTPEVLPLRRLRPAATLCGSLVAGLLAVTACAPSGTTATAPSPGVTPGSSTGATRADPRVGLRPGLFDAGEALWNLRLVSTTPPPREFVGTPNSDLAFLGSYVFQGNFGGFQVWDIADPNQPSLVKGYVCPASQSDVSVFRNLLFVSGEGFEGRLDCGAQGVETAVSPDRLRGIRIFDISDIRNPKYVANVQTCRGSHTHSLLVDPRDRENVYVYVSGSAPVRPAEEMPGCSGAQPSVDSSTALFRIEVIRVPLADPGRAAIVSSPRIFAELVAPPEHGHAPEDLAEAARTAAAARARGEFTAVLFGMEEVAPSEFVQPLLDSIVAARNGTGPPTAADSAALRAEFQNIVDLRINARPRRRTGPTQCHDITLYPEIGRAGGACEGYGFLLDIRDPLQPRRLAAVADSNFAYWHSATLNNDGTKLLFSDEWGGGGGPKCRETDPKAWGANAIYAIEGGELVFKSYYKIPAAQTSQENCVAHNGSLLPIPGRDVMAQSWYQGGISVFDWTDASNPFEIAFHDRGPVDADRMAMGGTWSVYWYNGLLVSSEMARGLDIFELLPSEHLTQNEIDAANTVRLEYFNPQGQPRFVWPTSFALARAYVDQLERSRGLPAARISSLRQELAAAERAATPARREALARLATQLEGEATRSPDTARVRLLVGAVRELAAVAGR